MSLEFDISPGLQKTIDKLVQKDISLAVAVRKKIDQIISSDIISLKHYKNLTGPMSHLKRVHIGHFVLLFRVEGNTIIFERFCHHDEAY